MMKKRIYITVCGGCLDSVEIYPQKGNEDTEVVLFDWDNVEGDTQCIICHEQLEVKWDRVEYFLKGDLLTDDEIERLRIARFLHIAERRFINQKWFCPRCGFNEAEHESMEQLIKLYEQTFDGPNPNETPGKGNSNTND